MITAIRTARPVGWRPDITYEQVPGVYDRRRKFIVVGTVGRFLHDQHILLHEFGHAVGDLLELNDSSVLSAYHRDAHYWTRLSPYFRGSYPGDPRGQRETLAELFRDRILSAEDARRRWGNDLVAWLEHELDLV